MDKTGRQEKSEAATIETRRRKKNDIFKKRSESVTEMKETEQIYSLKRDTRTRGTRIF